MAKGELLFNLMAERYSRQPIANLPAYEKKLEITRKYLTLQSTVFEFGCGTGSTALLHAPYVAHIRATDYAKKMIEIGNRKKAEQGVENVEFVKADINTMDIAPEYDVVLGLNILQLMEDIDATISKCYELLKPGGYFISSSVCVTTPSGAWRFVIPLLNLLQIMPKLPGFSVEGLLASMRSAGFTIEEQYILDGDMPTAFLVVKKPG